MNSCVHRLIKKVPPEAERKVFYNVAAQIFADGVFNWGRVVALFYFAYKVCIKVSLHFSSSALCVCVCLSLCAYVRVRECVSVF